MSFPWNRKKTAEPIARARTTAPSSNREVQPRPPPQPQPLSYRQQLQQRLQKSQWQSTFNVDCSGPQHAQLWKFTYFLGPTMIGESDWFTNKDAAKENAAMQALAWLNKNYPRAPSPGAETPSYRQLLQQRLQKYQWQSTFSVDCDGPQHAQLWKVSFFLGSTKIGESSWFTNKDAAKENAAMQAVGWLNIYGYH